MIDLTTQLNNYAVTCEGKANACRKRAGEIRQQVTTAGQWPAYDASIAAKATAEDSAAAQWERRGAEARSGFYLADGGAPGMSMQSDEFTDLYSEALSAARVKFDPPQFAAGVAAK